MIDEMWWYTKFREIIRNATDEELPSLYDKLYDEYLCPYRDHLPHEEDVLVWISGEQIKIKDIVNDYRFIRFLIKQFRSDGKILELGCGSSSFSYIMATDEYHVNAVDMRCKVIENHRKQVMLLPQKYWDMLYFDCALAENLPYPDGVFDIIVGADFLEHVRNIHRVLEECLRVLKHDGKMFFATPLEGIQWSPEHLHNFKKEDLEKIFNHHEMKSRFYLERYSWERLEPNVIIAEVWR